MMISHEEFESAMAMGKAKTLERTRESMKRRVKEDIHDAMSWWACFEPTTPPVDASSTGGLTGQQTHAPTKPSAKIPSVGFPSSGNSVEEKTGAPTKPTVKIGRNEPCPCGSGLKYKKCCLGKAS